MCRQRHKTVFLILIIATSLATGQYNDDIEQIKCCEQSTKSFELPFVLNRFRLNGTIQTPTSPCIRILLQSLLTAERTESLSALKFDHDRRNHTTNAQQYVMYCNNASVAFIDDFVAQSISDKSNGQSTGAIHSDRDVLSGVILLNVPLNGDNRNGTSRLPADVNRQLVINANKTEYLAWTDSQLNSDAFDAWINGQAQISGEFHRLTHLDLSDNQLTNLTSSMFKSVPNLLALNLSANAINDLPRTFTENGFQQLQFLDLSRNQLKIIPYQIFQPMRALQVLNLQCNRFVNFLENFFIENKALTMLNLSNNTINKVLANSFNGLSSLVDLDLSNNQIISVDLTAFDSLQALQRLNLAGNNLTILPKSLFYRLLELRQLVLSGNKFKTLPLGLFAKQFALQELIIDETSLHNLGNLVSRNPDEVNKDVLKQLRHVSIRKNKKLREIEAATFRSLTAVEHLNLSGNGLVTLPNEIGEMTELTHLDISKNDLISIPKQLNTLPHLHTISMVGNSFNCDCQMVWLAAWVNETRANVVNASLIEQTAPFNQLNVLRCHQGYPGDFLRVLQQQQCSKPTAVHVSESKTYKLRTDAQLECSFEGSPKPDLIWVTPLNKIIPYYADADTKPMQLMGKNTTELNADLQHQVKTREKMEHQILKHKHINFTQAIGANEVTLLENGSLRVHNISRKDSGLYICYGYNVMGYTSAEIRYGVHFKFANQMRNHISPRLIRLSIFQIIYRSHRILSGENGQHSNGPAQCNSVSAIDIDNSGYPSMFQKVSNAIDALIMQAPPELLWSE